MTFLKEFLDKVSSLILDNKRSLDIEESIKVGSIHSSKLEKKKIKHALFCLDLTPKVVFYAIDNEIDIILVHESYEIWKNSKVQDEIISLMKILIEKNIYLFFFQKKSLINNKLNEFLISILNSELDSTFQIELDGEDVPIGRIGRLKVKGMSAKSYLGFVLEKLDLKRVQYHLDENTKEIGKFLILGGTTTNYDIIKAAKKRNIKTILGEGLNHEMLHYCQFYEMNFIDITRIGLIKAFKLLIHNLEMELIDVDFSFFEENITFSVYEK